MIHNPNLDTIQHQHYASLTQEDAPLPREESAYLANLKRNRDEYRRKLDARASARTTKP